MVVTEHPDGSITIHPAPAEDPDLRLDYRRRLAGERLNEIERLKQERDTAPVPRCARVLER